MHSILLNLSFLFLVLASIALLLAGMLRRLVENCLYKYLRFATLVRLRLLTTTCFQSAASAGIASFVAAILALLTGGDISAH